MTNLQTQQTRPHLFYAGLLVLLTLWMALPGIDSIPVIDRDEARYAQATVQMVESGDYVNIKFQDTARNKKPAGIYWMQAAPVKAFTAPGERHIWAHRLPSALAALIAVLAVYWGGIAILSRCAAFISAGILATSALFVFESHIAKTDAMLCAMAAIVLACLLRQRRAPTQGQAILFWAAVGIGIMVKGPIIPAITLFTLLGLLLWERDGAWTKSLINLPGMLLCALIVLPWSIMIWLATDGTFFTEAIGNDLAPKLAGGQEKHGAPPGYYLATLPLLFWPGSLVLLCGLVLGTRAARQTSDANKSIASAARLLLMWIVPFWVVLEIVPTKLPNYLLPVYPALALLCGGAISAMLSVGGFKVSRRIGAALFLIVSLVLITVILSAEALYAPQQGLVVWIGIICVAITFYAVGSFWSGRASKALIAALVCAVTLSMTTYQFVLPKLQTLFVSHRIQAALIEAGVDLPRHGGPQILSPHFTEPSLVYRLGTSILLGDKTETAFQSELDVDSLILFDTARETSKSELAALKAEACFEELGSVEGVNYSKGDKVNIAILRPAVCQQDPVTAP